MVRGMGRKRLGIIGCKEQEPFIQMTIQLIILYCIFYTLRSADRPQAHFKGFVLIWCLLHKELHKKNLKGSFRFHMLSI